MKDAERARAAGLLAMAIRDTTPDNERKNAAFAFCKLADKLGLIPPDETERRPTVSMAAAPETRTIVRRVPVTGVRLPSGRVVSQEQAMRVLRKLWRERSQ